MTHRHSKVHFGGQFTLMTSNKQINRQTATIMFKWQHKNIVRILDILGSELCFWKCKIYLSVADLFFYSTMLMI